MLHDIALYKFNIHIHIHIHVSIHSVCAVYDLRVTSCPTSRVADVTVGAQSSTVGYVSNTLAGLNHSLCGRRSCPWLVRAVPGQRVQLSLVLLGQLRHSVDCPSVAVSESRDDHDVIDDVIVDKHRTFNVCSTVTRQRHLFTSSGHVLAVYTTSVNRSGQGQSEGQDLGHDAVATAGRRFLLMYTSLCFINYFILFT